MAAGRAQLPPLRPPRSRGYYPEAPALRHGCLIDERLICGAARAVLDGRNRYRACVACNYVCARNSKRKTRCSFHWAMGGFPRQAL